MDAVKRALEWWWPCPNPTKTQKVMDNPSWRPKIPTKAPTDVMGPTDAPGKEQGLVQWKIDGFWVEKGQFREVQGGLDLGSAGRLE